MKAIILAAGKGTRLRPVTLTTPKPLVPVANRPLIAYALDMIKGGGMSEVGIVVNSLDSSLVRRIGDGKQLGVNVSYIVQEEQKGLAHAVSLCQDFLDGEAFAMFLGDNIIQDKMSDLLKNFEASDYEAGIALGEVPDPERFGVAIVEDGKVTQLLEKPNPAPSNLAVAGIYLFRQSIFDSIAQIEPSARGELEITDAIQHTIEAGKKVQAYITQGWWIDAGKPEAIINANQLVMSELPYTPAPEFDGIDDDSKLSPRVHLGENVTIKNSVIRGPVVIGDNVEIVDSYVGPYTALGNDVTVIASEIEASIVMRGSTLRNIPGRIDSSLVADNSTVEAAKKRVPRSQRFVLAEGSYVQLG